MQRNPRQCPKCRAMISEKKYNRHIARNRCGAPSIKKFIKYYRLMMAGHRIPHRHENFVKNCLATMPIKWLERVFARVAKMDPYTELEDLRHGQRLSKPEYFSIFRR